MNLKRCLRGLFLLLLAILCAVFAVSGNGDWTGWLLIPTGVFTLLGIYAFLRGTFQKSE